MLHALFLEVCCRNLVIDMTLIKVGRRLDELYVTTAKTDYNGEDLPDRCDGGDLFVVRDLGFTGLERNRYVGNVSY